MAWDKPLVPEIAWVVAPTARDWHVAVSIPGKTLRQGSSLFLKSIRLKRQLLKSTWNETSYNFIPKVHSLKLEHDVPRSRIIRSKHVQNCVFKASGASRLE